MDKKSFGKGHSEVLVTVNKEVKQIWLTSRSTWSFVTLCDLNVSVWPVFNLSPPFNALCYREAFCSQACLCTGNITGDHSYCRIYIKPLIFFYLAARDMMTSPEFAKYFTVIVQLSYRFVNTSYYAINQIPNIRIVGKINLQ